MAAALLWPSSEEKYFLYCKQASPAGLACLLFHGKGRNGRRHLLALAPLRGASRQLGNKPSQALRASSPEGRAKTVEGVFLASPFERLPPVGGRCRAATKRGQGVTEGDGEGAPAPLRGAAAAAAEGPSNRRSEKKCNGDDRRQRRIQGGAVGAAVSRTRVPLKARSGRWAPQPVLAKRLAFFRFDFCFGVTRGEQPLVRGSSASKSLALFWFSFVRQKRTFPARRSISRKGRNFFYSTPLQFASFYGQLI